ncbi:MAG TPA: hypothetical protein K8V97_05940, partial [Jeotgalicoccus aerolatus]|nr:hypothetical protein [Jeotgalicoccus aerolatus]
GSGESEESAETTEEAQDNAAEETAEDDAAEEESAETESESETDAEGDASEDATEETDDSESEDSAETESEDTESDSEMDSGTESDTDSETGTETESDSSMEDDSSDNSASDDAEGDTAAGTSEQRNIDFAPIDETVTGADGTEMTTKFELNSGIGETLSSASESDASIEEVMMPKEDVTTYYAETFMVINLYAAGNTETPADNDMAGLTAEIDEREEMEVFSGQFDPATSTVVPYAYANSESLFVNEGGMWNDYTGQAPADQIYYGSYSNLYDAFMESSEVINVSEDDDNYYLHNIGTETVLHDTFGTLFNVEFTNADTSQQKNGVVGVVDKESQELVHIAYMSSAPGITEGEMLHIEIASGLGNYGEYDESGITVPEGIYE